MLGIGLGALVLVLAIGGGMAALGLLSPKNQGVTAQVVPSNPVLPAVPNTPEPSLPLPIEEAKGMPKDVLDWLEHLRRTDDRKREVVDRQVGELKAMIASMSLGGVTVDALADPDADLRTERQQSLESNTGHFASDIRDLSRIREDFMRFPAPAECVPIQASYAQALRETEAMYADMIPIFEKITSADPTQLQSLSGEIHALQNDSVPRIDELRGQTDHQVGQICTKYSTRRWFSIARDIGGGLGGLLGGIPGF